MAKKGRKGEEKALKDEDEAKRKDEEKPDDVGLYISKLPV
jgi:hypothetical protein